MPFVYADLAPQHLCAHCGFDLRAAARISVTAAARRLERSIDDFSKAQIAKRSPAIHNWAERLARLTELAGFEFGRSLVELSTSAQPRCFERLAQSADESAAAAGARRRRPARTAGGRNGLVGGFVEFVDARRPSRPAAWTPDLDLAGLVTGYAHAARRAFPVKPYGDDRDRAT